MVLALLVGICAIALSGCEYEDTVSMIRDRPVPTVKPGQDATFTFVRTEQNKDGVGIGTVTWREDRITDTSFLLDSYLHAYAVYDGRDTSFIRYEGSGDLSIRVAPNILRHISREWGSFPLSKKWITLPFQTGIRQFDTLADVASYNDGSALVHLLVTAETEYQRRSLVSVDGVTLITHQTGTTITINVGSERHSIRAIHVFAPWIGYFTAVDIRANPSPSAVNILSNGYLKQLTDFDFR